MQQFSRALVRAPLWLCAVFFCATGCDGRHSQDSAKTLTSTDSQTLFEEITAKVGFDEHPAIWPATETYADTEDMSGGVALLDYDNDGRLDILRLCHPAPNARDQSVLNHLYRQQTDGTFRDVTQAAGLTTPGNALGVAVGDVDNDGFVDLYITGYGHDTFYHNNGDGTFSDWTARAGFSTDKRHWSTSAAFFDYDRDGFLDLIVLHYSEPDDPKTCIGPDGKPDYCGPRKYNGALATLWHNNGDGTFTDVTAKMGINLPGRGLGVVCADFNGDGWPDIFVANDQERNHLWINQQGKGFVEEALPRGLAFNGAGQMGSNMGVAVGDVTGRGALDLYVTRLFGETDPLFINDGRGHWTDKCASAGLGAVDISHSGWGCGFVDFDNDGELDLIKVDGQLMRKRTNPLDVELGPFWSQYADRNLVFRNLGDGKFADVSQQAGTFTSRPGVNIGLAFGDLDNDGAVDLVSSAVDTSIRVFHNRAPKPGAHWLSIRALTGKRDAIGAQVTVVTPQRRWLSLIATTYSYLSSNDPRAHFGLGSVDHVETIEVLWVSGRRERFRCPGVDRQITIREGEGE